MVLTLPSRCHQTVNTCSFQFASSVTFFCLLSTLPLGMNWGLTLSHQSSFTPEESKPPAWLEWHLLSWSNKLNIYDIQEIRAWGNLCIKINVPCVDKVSRESRLALLLLLIRGASLGQTHNFPAQHEWRWITATAWILKWAALFQLCALSWVFCWYPWFFCCQRGTGCRNHLEIFSLWIHYRYVLCFASSALSIPGWKLTCSMKRSVRSSRLLHWSIEQLFCTEIISFSGWLTKCLCRLSHKSHASFIKPLLVSLRQRIAVIHSECSLRNFNKCSFQALTEMQVHW